MSPAPEPNTPAVADGDVPAIIRSAGDAAVRVYREFLDDPARKTSTRALYAQIIRNFCRWSESRGLSLDTTTPADITAYAMADAGRTSLANARLKLAAIRGLFRHLVHGGVCAENPCHVALPEIRTAATDAIGIEAAGAVPAVRGSAASSSAMGPLVSKIEGLANDAYQRGWRDALEAVMGEARKAFMPKRMRKSAAGHSAAGTQEVPDAR